MRSAPPRAAEAVTGLLIPPACREEVLGDLHERYTSPQQYILDILCTVPLVIVSRIRRTADPAVLLMQAFVLYISFWSAAWYVDRAFLQDQFGLLRLAIPAAIALVTLILEDAYAKPGKRSPLKPIRGPVFAVAVAFLSQPVLTTGSRELALPRWIMLYGGAMSCLLASTVRMLFPPVVDRPQGANGPAFWLKQTVEPLKISQDTIRLLKGVGAIIVLTMLGAWAGILPHLRQVFFVAAIGLLVVYQLSKRG